MQIDFSAAFDRVNHHGILYRLCSVGIGGSVLSILTQFLSNLSKHFMVGGSRSKLVDVVSGVPQGSVLGRLLFFLYSLELFFILQNKLIGYTDNSTLMAVVPSPGVRVTVAESLICDIGRVSEWCDIWGMKLNASKTKTMIVSMSCTMHPQSPPLTIAGTVQIESDDLVILGVTFDSKLTFENHLRLVSRAASQRLGILRKSSRMFHDRSLLERCFRCFVLPVFQHCSVVWCSAADAHLKLLDRAVSGARLLTGGVFECDIPHRRSVAFSVCCIRSGVTRCTRLMMRYLDRMCQCGLHAVTWSHIGILMRHLAAEPRSTAGPLFPSQCPSGTILLTPYSMVWDWRVSRAGPMLFYWPKLLYPYYSLLLFLHLSSSCLLVGIVGLGSSN